MRVVCIVREAQERVSASQAYENFHLQKIFSQQNESMDIRKMKHLFPQAVQVTNVYEKMLC